MAEILGRLRKDDVNDDLVWERGGGWWIGDEQTSGAVGNKLLRLCLISESNMVINSQTYKVYGINEDGRGCLDDPRYVPRIVRKLRKRRNLRCLLMHRTEER